MGTDMFERKLPKTRKRTTRNKSWCSHRAGRSSCSHIIRIDIPGNTRSFRHSSKNGITLNICMLIKFWKSQHYSHRKQMEEWTIAQPPRTLLNTNDNCGTCLTLVSIMELTKQPLVNASEPSTVLHVRV